jgi:hypothetical protein
MVTNHLPWPYTEIKNEQNVIVTVKMLTGSVSLSLYHFRTGREHSPGVKSVGTLTSDSLASITPSV